LLLPPPLAMSPAGRPAAAGNVGPKPAGGWGGITARLQKLRADLRETQARLHTAEQASRTTTQAMFPALFSTLSQLVHRCRH